jgi:chromosome segregation ATPase
MLTYTGAQDRMELEQVRSRQIELENRCRHYETNLHQKEQSIRALQDECMAAAEKLRQTQLQYDHYQRMPLDERETSALRSMLDSKQARVDQLEQRIAVYESEIAQLRELRFTAPRDFTDKSVTDREYQDMKLRVRHSFIQKV